VRCQWWDGKKKAFVTNEFIEAELVARNDDDDVLPVIRG
jgi:hypothetical protein